MPCSVSSSWRKRLGRLKPWAVNACRGLLALTFLLSGWVKANDPIGMAIKLGDYTAALGLTSGENPLLLPAAVALAFVEFSLGVHLLLGLHRRQTAVWSVALMGAMTALTVWLALTDAVKDCGCFGDVVILSNVQTLEKNVVLMACALALLRYHRLQPRLLGESTAWLVTLPAMVGVVVYAAWCVFTLPKVDFRPYAQATDLRAAWTQSLSHAPEPTSLPATWLSHRPDVMNLSMMRFDTGEDLTEQVLSDRGVTLLLVAPSLATADQGCAGNVNLLYDYALQHGMAMYCLTASDSAAQAHWADYTGAEYPYLECDAQLLRTMVRANPGLVVLRDGVVLRKWSNWNMPDDLQLEALLRARTPGSR